MATNRFFIVIALIAALSGILFGYDTGVISGAILFISDQFKLTSELNGIVVGAVLLGALLGALISGRLADRFGRKNLLIADAIIFMIGTGAAAIAPTILFLILGRIIVGIAIGIASYAAPLYISEIAPMKHRGALVSLNQLMITLGIFLSYIVDYCFAQHGNWRAMFLMGLVPACLLLIGMLFLPCSPRWILTRGYSQKALEILYRLRGDAELAQTELNEIELSLQQQQRSWRALFSKAVRPTLYIGIGLAVLQQVTGVNTILYYAPTIFKLAGFDNAIGAILASMGIGVVFVIATLIGLPFIDRWGRRPLLLSGLIGMMLSLFALSLVFHLSHTSLGVLRWLALASMLVYIAAFAVSLGPIMWLMIAEIYPLKVRGRGASLATAANWGSNMVVAVTFLSLIDHLGSSGTFLVYALISILGIGFVYGFVPETRGVSLEEIESNLYAGKACRHLGTPLHDN